MGIGGGTGSTINQMMNNSNSANNITRNESNKSNTSGGNLQFPGDQPHAAKDNVDPNEVG